MSKISKNSRKGVHFLVKLQASHFTSRTFSDGCSRNKWLLNLSKLIKLKINSKMKPTICFKIFSFSVDGIMSTVVNFICSKIAFELFIHVKYKWIWKQKSSVGAILKCEPVSCKSAGCELNNLRIASCKSTNLQVVSCNSTRKWVVSCESISNWVASHIKLHIDSRL